MNRKTLDDMPNIMNSISYHLKRIADELEAKNKKNMVDSGEINIDVKSQRVIDLIKNLKK